MKEPHAYLPRRQETKLKEFFKYFPVVVVTGARQVGKSTLLRKVFGKKTEVVVFDPSIDIENARKDPDLFLSNHHTPLILDEIQYAPELIPSIKRRLEKDRSPGQYLITGSQQWSVMRLLAESLAGRAAFIELEGLSLAELSQPSPQNIFLEQWLSQSKNGFEFKKSSFKKNLFNLMWTGFLPEAHFLPDNLLPDFFKSYVSSYIERDVRLMSEISDATLFARFYKLCAALTAQEINFSQLGRELGLNPQTTSRWLSLLKHSFQWFEVPAYSGNLIKRISQAPKGYFADTGLACWAQAISTPESIGSHPLWGALFETFVVAEIRKQCRFLSGSPNLYHWRIHSGAEVDLLIEWNGRFYPLEIKGGTQPTKRDASGIKSFRKSYPKLDIAKALIICASETFYKIDSNEETYVLPWDFG